MAGNIVKWWKHKILGGYKQFSVLQECTTDSEELIYPVRAPSSCSAPPDLLMVSDRETVQLKQSVNIISTSKGHHHHNHHSHHNQAQQHQNMPTPPHQQQQQYSQNHQSVHQHHSQQQKEHHSKKATSTSHTTAALVNKNHESPLIDIDSGELNGGSGGGIGVGGKTGVDERIRLEEFTCDVSVESGKSSQPLQFSFTFYDLDGHHGKITKDDIAGIVYTIYESIGKSVVVPYCGSKTINVRLTVSPEAKSKSSSSKLKKLNTTVGVEDGGGGGGGSAPPTGRHQSSSAQRRQHRYRPRKLIKSDEEEDDPESDSEKDMLKKSSGNSKSHHNHLESKLCCNGADADNMTKQHSTTHQQQPSTSCKFQPLNITENIYESVSNLKFNGRGESTRKDDAMLECKECVQSTLAEAVQRHHQQQQQAKQIMTRSKLLRRTRKHKDQCVEARQRSLSVGNESSWKIRGVHITKNINGGSQLPTAAVSSTTTTTSTTNATGAPTMVDEVDSSVSPNQGGGSNSPNNECWNNGLKRNDLIDIIRASMEKNRLCFQGSGKPHHQQNGVSPVRHRQRSHTISKIVNDTGVADIYHQHQSHHHQQQQQQQTHQPQQQPPHHHTSQQQTSHHIPIYHQQMAINPAILMSHPKTNLCGYDSFLHATICTSANNSPNSVLVPNQQPQHNMLSSPTTTVPPATKSFINSMKQQHQRSSSKAMRNGLVGGSNVGYHSQQNSPQFHGGYVLEPQKLNSSLLNALNPQITAERKLIRTIDNVEKWLNEKEHLKCSAMTSPTSMKYDEGKLKKDEKNYDNLLYSKLNEKFLDVSTAAVVSSKKILNNNNSNNNNSSSVVASSHHHNSPNNALSSNKENERHHHHSHHHNHLQRLAKYNMMSSSQSGSVSPLGGASSTTTATTAIDRSKFAPLVAIDVVDPIECENLIHTNTSDEESVSLSPVTPTKDSGSEGKVLNSSTRSSSYATKKVANREDALNGSASTSGSCSGASNNGNNSTASTVHRYVHEHIHHHYHHFENNEE